ncbi:MAG TPA: glycosyltransferase family 4 protein, partial [Vicinamibacteria bacterium]|nr:glycosyltransferase family 4 protein [Vicinamibacteria bacterium]
VGGAELHCRWVAEHLAERHQVEVLTTTATDYLSWQNVLPAGISQVNGITVRRFPVARERREEVFFPVANKVCFFEHGDEEERQWLEEHGPVTPALVEHLRRHEQDYDAIVFFSYRYWTTYFGMQVAPHKSLLVPTAEHDRVLYLRLFREFFRLPAAIVFNTPEEKDLIERVTGNDVLPGEVVGTGINRPAVVPVDEVAPRLDLLGDYLVYVGRIEPEKGCAVMIDHFLRWQRETRAATTLALFGRSTMTFSENAHVRLMGVVPDGEKLAAIARARALVMPSRHESLSMVVLEAWMMNRPVLVNGDCEVLRGQVLRANGGLYYRRYEEFAAAMDLLVSAPGLADRLGRQGHAYFQENYAWERIMEKYERLLARAASAARP